MRLRAAYPTPGMKLAREELFIAEGSDWNWWYGPEHESANRIEFDQIYREHLANVYRALGMAPPAELSRPILQLEVDETHTPPSGAIQPKINGVVDSYFEWLGAGIYRVDRRSGSMHGKRALVRHVYYGADENNVFLRVDFEEEAAALERLEIYIHLDGAENAAAQIRIEAGAAVIVRGRVRAAFRDVLEIALPKEEDFEGGSLSFWQEGLPIEAIPREGVLRVTALVSWNA